MFIGKFSGNLSFLVSEKVKAKKKAIQDLPRAQAFGQNGFPWPFAWATGKKVRGFHESLEPFRLGGFLQCSNSRQVLAFHQVKKRSPSGGDVGDSVALTRPVNSHVRLPTSHDGQGIGVGYRIDH